MISPMTEEERQRAKERTMANKEQRDVKVDINKKYRTKCGYDVVIYAIYEDQEFGVHGAYYDCERWHLTPWPLDGRFAGSLPNGLDLVEVKPERVVWINEYEDGTVGGAHGSKEYTDYFASASGRLALHRVVLSEDTVWKGDGDE